MSMTRATIAPSGRLLKRVPSSLTYSARLAVAFGVIFITVLVLGGILNYIIGRLVSETGFAGTRRRGFTPSTSSKRGAAR